MFSWRMENICGKLDGGVVREYLNKSGWFAEVYLRGNWKNILFEHEVDKLIISFFE